MARLPTRRSDERVMPLELFFDLVFVLAITQCTALMADEHSWEGIGKGLLVLAALWWSWVGYSWLTSVVDPEEGGVRLAMFTAMAALLVMALAVPEAFDDEAVTFAVAYAVVRFAQLALFWLASEGDESLRHSLRTGLIWSTVVGVGLLGTASQLDGAAQGAVWAAAIALDVLGPYLFGSEGWELVPEHFSERHALIVIIALGESIVAIGVGAGHDLDGGILTAAVLGVALAAGLWWSYFDIVTYMAAENLGKAEVGKVQNELARDCYSLLHFPMVAGIVLAAFGVEATLAHVGDPLERVQATALLGGVAVYLLGHVAVAYRDHRALKVHRVAAAAASIALLAVSSSVDALPLLGIVTAIVAVMVAFETVRYAEDRDRIRHQRHASSGSNP